MCRYKCILLFPGIIVQLLCSSCVHSQPKPEVIGIGNIKAGNLQDIRVNEFNMQGRISQFRTSGHYLMASVEDGYAYFWDWRNISKLALRVKRRGYFAHAMNCLNDRWLLDRYSTENKDVIFQVDIHSGEIVKQWNIDNNREYTISISNSQNGKHVALSRSFYGPRSRYATITNKITIVSANTMGNVAKVIGMKQNVNYGHMAISNDGNYLVYIAFFKCSTASKKGKYLFSCGYNLCVHDILTGNIIDLGIDRAQTTDNILIGPSNKYVYIGGTPGYGINGVYDDTQGDSVLVYDIKMGRLIKKFIVVSRKTNRFPITGMDVSPNGHWLLVSSIEPEPGVVYLWDLTTNKKVAAWKGKVKQVTFSSDSRHFAARTFKRGEICIYNIPSILLKHSSVDQHIGK